MRRTHIYWRWSTAQVAEEAALRVGADWFAVPGGERQDIGRYGACRRMLAALVGVRQRDPGTPLDLNAMFAAGWPGERIAFDSMRNRIHVNLARLRRMGLKRVLRRSDDGYFLDPEVPFIAK